MPAFHRLTLLALALLNCLSLVAQENTEQSTYTLKEPSDQSRPFAVKYTLDITGILSEQSAGAEKKTFPLKSTAKLEYTERRLPSAGRDAAAFRALRYFDKHETDVLVEEHKTQLRLPADNRLFVVQGHGSELVYYPPSKLLSARLLEQLQIPFETLSALSLLPRIPVAVGETWTPETWAQQIATNIEAVLESDFTCQLDEVRGQVALVSMKGKLKGGRFGAEALIEFEGGYEFDLVKNYLRELHVTLRDKSSISPVSPGLDVAVNIRFTREPTTDHPQLKDVLLEQIPLDPAPERLLLHFDSQWGTRFLHTRDWHIIPGKYVILRLIESGSLLSQGTMMNLPKSSPGEHLNTRQFQADIQKSLGDRLTKIELAEEIPTRDGRYLYRVTATGNSNGRQMVWQYYLCAHPDGRQVSVVFATEAELLEELGQRDLQLMNSLSWPPQVTPELAP